LTLLKSRLNESDDLKTVLGDGQSEWMRRTKRPAWTLETETALLNGDGHVNMRSSRSSNDLRRKTGGRTLGERPGRRTIPSRWRA
jgi:hypothetical protein